MLRSYKNRKPACHDRAYIDPDASLIGDITIGEDSSVWPQACLRGDFGPIRIGDRSNVQDGAVVHMDAGITVTIGDEVTIGHGAIVHGCTIGNNCLVGMNATVLDRAVVGDNCLIGAGAMVPAGMEIPEGSMVLGVPAKVVRKLKDEEIAMIRDNAVDYVGRLDAYRSQK